MLNAPEASSRKIAVLTFHAAYNCGAILQAWALQTVLRRVGLDPTFPDCTKVGSFRRFDPVWYKPKPKEDAGWLARMWFVIRQELGALGVEDLKRFRFRRFIRRALNVKAMSVGDIENNFSAVIVGSDQVWNHFITRGETDYFRTTVFADSTLRRYTYAVSMGDAVPPAEEARRLAEAAGMFENLSVRENLLPELLDRHGNHPVVDPDPTLLLTKDDFACVACPKRLVKGRYLFVYSLVHNAKLWASARTIAKEMGLKPVLALAYRYGRGGKIDGGEVDVGVSPDRLLAYVRDADAVISSTFHGTTFPIVYGKRYATFVRAVKDRVSLRCTRLLQSLREEAHRIDDPDDLDSIRRALAIEAGPEIRETVRTRASEAVGRLKAILSDMQG